MILAGKSIPQWFVFIRDKVGGSKLNQDLVWSFFSMAILAAGGFIINLLIVHFRGDEALGIFNQVFVFYQIASQFTVGGIHLSVLKEVSYNQDDHRLCSDIAFAGLFLVAILATVLTLLAYSLSSQIGAVLKSESVGNALRLAIPGLLVFSLNKVLLWTLNGLRHMRVYAFFQAMRYILLTGVVVLLIITGQPSVLLPLALTVSELILFIFLFPYVGTRLPMPDSLAKIRVWIPRHVSFGLRGFLSQALNEMNGRVDVLILGIFVSDAQVGIYSFASTLAGGFIQLPMILRWNIDPLMGAHFATKEESHIEELAKKVRRYFYPAMISICTMVALGYPLIFSLLLKKSSIAYASWGGFAILIVGIMIASRFRPFYGILLQGGRPGTHTLMLSALTITVVGLNLLLIPILGIYGAAMSVLLMYALEATLISYNARRLFNIRL